VNHPTFHAIGPLDAWMHHCQCGVKIAGIKSGIRSPKKNLWRHISSHDAAQHRE
jgi:hypothetical protein